jgi:hypothetical protein
MKKKYTPHLIKNNQQQLTNDNQLVKQINELSYVSIFNE